jgi:hypothetical protein
MKNFTTEQLLNAMHSLDTMSNDEVLNHFKNLLNDEIKKRTAKPFVKATDAYLAKLTREDVTVRLMEPTDEFYVNGFYGLFENKSGKLLRRHSDRGWLGGHQNNF